MTEPLTRGPAPCRKPRRPPRFQKSHSYRSPMLARRGSTRRGGDVHRGAFRAGNPRPPVFPRSPRRHPAVSPWTQPGSWGHGRAPPKLACPTLRGIPRDGFACDRTAVIHRSSRPPRFPRINGSRSLEESHSLSPILLAKPRRHKKRNEIRAIIDLDGGLTGRRFNHLCPGRE